MLLSRCAGPPGGQCCGLGLCLLTRPPFLLQVSQFLWNHGDIAFAPLGRLLLENFKMEGAHVSNSGWPGGGGGRPTSHRGGPSGV